MPSCRQAYGRVSRSRSFPALFVSTVACAHARVPDIEALVRSKGRWRIGTIWIVIIVAAVIVVAVVQLVVLSLSFKDRQQKGPQRGMPPISFYAIRLLYKHDWAELCGGTMAAAW